MTPAAPRGSLLFRGFPEVDLEQTRLSPGATRLNFSVLGVLGVSQNFSWRPLYANRGCVAVVDCGCVSVALSLHA